MVLYILSEGMIGGIYYSKSIYNMSELTCASGTGMSWDVSFVDNSIESFSLSFLMAITILKHCIVYPKGNFKVQ